MALLIFFILNFKNYRRSIKNYILSILISIILLTPHFIWLFNYDFITILYGLDRSGLSDFNLIIHLKNPIFFLFKQTIILIPLFIMSFVIVKKFRFKISLKDRKTFFLLSINLIPIFLMFITSILTGAKIRTMWMTPFYLFFGTLILFVLKRYIDLKKIKNFLLFSYASSLFQF